jgi:hypothetical protein
MGGLNLIKLDLSKRFHDLNFISKLFVKIITKIYPYVNESYKKIFRKIVLNKKFLINYINYYKKNFEPKRLIVQKILKLKKSNFILIHIGSGSGQETDYISKIKNIKIYSVEFYKYIINFQKKTLNLSTQNKKIKFLLYKKNFFYKLYKKNKIKQIYFSSSSLQFATPEFIKEFFISLSKIYYSEILIYEPIIIKKNIIQNKYNNFFTYSHDYRQLAKENNFKIIEENIIFKKKNNRAVYFAHFKQI